MERRIVYFRSWIEAQFKHVQPEFSATGEERSLALCPPPVVASLFRDNALDEIAVCGSFVIQRIKDLSNSSVVLNRVWNEDLGC
jgi:hypothetical protein